MSLVKAIVDNYVETNLFEKEDSNVLRQVVSDNEEATLIELEHNAETGEFLVIIGAEEIVLNVNKEGFEKELHAILEPYMNIIL